MSTRGRKPDPSVDARIKQATMTLMLAKGMDFTVDEVAEEAGVGRATVFRRYATKRDMLLEALRQAMDVFVPTPDTGSLYGDLLVIVTHTLGAWRDPAMARVSRQIFGEAGRDPAIAEVIRTSMRKRTEADWAIFERAIARGELSPDADLWLLADLVVGVATYRGLLEKDQADPEALTAALLRGFVSRM
ncbi:MAG: TetR/AcrR family transcriptional regulator [Nonomuraea sp.]|nr:TetR/AcrR family transcriptional regulator [Nonomuraea sp.]